LRIPLLSKLNVQFTPELARLGEAKLLPGMPVEVFIHSGERTVLSYLTKSLRDQVARTFRDG
jgi:HlyD family secretion protein